MQKQTEPTISSVTLILLLAAIVVFVYLYRALGTRNKEYENHRRAYKGASASVAPKSTPAPAAAVADTKLEVSEKSSDTELQRALLHIRANEPEFESRAFVKKSAQAYRYILSAYAKGEMTKLKPLLAPKVYATFQQSILERKKTKQSLTTEILSLATPIIKTIRLDGRQANIVMQFEAEVISVLRDENGTILEGDDNTAIALCDVWEFQRDLGASNPTWLLAKAHTELKEDKAQV